MPYCDESVLEEIIFNILIATLHNVSFAMTKLKSMCEFTTILRNFNIFFVKLINRFNYLMRVTFPFNSIS